MAFFVVLTLSTALYHTLSHPKSPEVPEIKTQVTAFSSPSPSPDSDTIIFAGISGHPPRFIDSGPNRGTGWVENMTQEVRKGMKEDGFKIKLEWMSPARIAHEFRVKSSICTFPFAWNDPKATFEKKPDRLYSIALDFEEESEHSIMFDRNKLARFKKHVNAKGDLNIEHLLDDPTLKVVFVRDQNYGRLTRKLIEINEAGDQVIRKKYEDHISLILPRDNRQLIEMLNANRFDYIFSNSIEDQDFVSSGIDKNHFDKLNYSTSHVKDLKDPELVQISIACAINPTQWPLYLT